MNVSSYVKELDQTINSSISKISNVESAEKAIFEELKISLAALEKYQNGTIKGNQKNFKTILNINKKLNSIILNESYTKSLNEFYKSFADVKKLNNQYFTSFVETIGESQTLAFVQETAIQLTKETLQGAGINTITNQISKIINNSILGNTTYKDLISELENVVLSGPSGQGLLSKHINQVANDALYQYSRNYNEVLSNDLGIEWYLYEGNEKTTTRYFCSQRVGRYFHKSEIEEWGKKPSLWNSQNTKFKGGGRIPSTNGTNIFTYLGGYSCRHILIPVSDAVVLGRDLKRIQK